MSKFLLKQSLKGINKRGGTKLLENELHTLTKQETHATADELNAVAKGHKHDVTSSDKALTAVREAEIAADLKKVEIMSKGTRRRDTLLGVAGLTTAAGGAGAVLYPVITGTNRIDQGLAAVGNTITSVEEGTSRKLRMMGKKLEGMANSIPNKSDILETVDTARNAAHDVTAAIPAAETALTIGAILIGAVVLYEVYRTFS